MTEHAVDTTVQQTVIDNEYGKLDIEIKDGKFPFIHLELRKWSKDVYREYLEVWVEIRREMRDRGFTDLYCLIPMEEKKARRIFRDRRGQEVISATTANMVIILLVFIVILLIAANFKDIILRASNFEACQKSISIAHVNYAKLERGKGRYSLDCIASHIVMTKDDVRSGQTANDAVNRLIAGQMIRCWRMVGQGEFNPFGGQLGQKFCLVCSVIDFNKKFRQEYSETIGLYKYLEENSETIEDVETTYAGFLPDGWNEPEQVEDTVDTSEPYVVFWQAKSRALTQGPLPESYVGFKPYGEMVGTGCDFIVN